VFWFFVEVEREHKIGHSSNKYKAFSSIKAHILFPEETMSENYFGEINALPLPLPYQFGRLLMSAPNDYFRFVIKKKITTAKSNT